MLTNLPTPDGMEQSALRLYFTAWGHVFRIIDEMTTDEMLSFSVKNGRTRPDDGNAGLVDEFITLAQPDLQLAYTLIQQSQEIGLKAKICAVSPFLLLLGSDVRTWPISDADFTQFRTLDASDLVKVVNSVCTQALSTRFANLYEVVRGHRNKIYHQGTFNDRLDPVVLLSALVTQYHELYPTRIWLSDRLDFQGQTRHGFFYTKHYNERTIVLLELLTLFALLTNTQYINLFGFSKKQRRYICHQCCHDARVEDSGVSPADIRTATLVEGKDAVFCHLCQTDYPVRRIACVCSSCKSNVISDDKDFAEICHLCGSEQSDTFTEAAHVHAP